MQEFFYPQSVAVIGALDSPNNLGRIVLENMIKSGFKGFMFPVGKGNGLVHGKPIYPSVLDIPEQIDLAFILIQAKHVPHVFEECGKKGIKRLIVSSAGFAEHGAEGGTFGKELLKLAQQYGMRFIGTEID